MEECEVLGDPKAVYDRIKSRHLVFGESRDEKEISSGPKATPSFDQPDLVRALVAASEGRVRVRLVCDLSQAKGETKMQLQVLQELATAGVHIRLATGKSVRDTYMSDNRDVRVGSGLQGLHHAKSVLVLRASSAAELVVGSTNWTTSSRANRECGVFLQTSTQHMIQGSRSKLRSRVGTR